MSHAHQITDVVQVKKFILAGKARFTLVSKLTGVRFTFKVNAKFDDNQYDAEGNIGASVTPKLWFVSVLTGSDNEADYTYLGQIWADSLGYAHGKKSKIGFAAPSAQAFYFFWRHVLDGRLHAGIEFWHCGQCAKCGRALTVPESIESGFGPVCAAMVGL